MKRLWQPGSFLWLLGHELTLNWRSAGLSTRWRNIIFVIMATYLLFGFLLAFGLMNEKIEASSYNRAVIFIVASALLLVDFSAGLRASQRVLYQSGDLELLLTSPIPPRRVLMAKLVIIAAVSLLFQTILIFPLLVPFVLVGHLILVSLLAVAIAISFYGACFGLALTLLFVRLGGARAARQMIQIFAALLGATVFISSQVIVNYAGRNAKGAGAITEWYLSRGYGSSGISGLPGKAAFGDPLSFIIFCGGAIALIALTVISLEKTFLRSYQAAGDGISAKKPAKRNFARHFSNNFRLTVLRKELILLFRDPVLIFHIMQKLIYLLPIAVLLMTLAPSSILLNAKIPGAGFVNVFLAGQLLGDLVNLVIFGEDAPDLLAASPRVAQQLTRLKLLAAFLIGAPILLIIPLLIAGTSVNASLIILLFTMISGCLAGAIEFKFTKPTAKRKSSRRLETSVLSTLATLLMIAAVGGLCSYTLHVVG